MHDENMSGAENGECASASAGGGITIHNFSERLMEQVIHFHVMKLDGGFFLWVGTAPVLSNLAVSMCSRFDTSSPLSSIVIGDPSDPSSSTLAQRLTKRTKKQVFVSFNLPGCPSQLSLLVEERIKKELELHPDKF